MDVLDPVKNLKYRWVVRKDGWKLIEPYAPNAAVELMNRPGRVDWLSQDAELYNVLDDPFEESGQAEARPELVKELRQGLDAWWPVPE